MFIVLCAQFGEGKCPTVPFTPIARAFDNGDVTGPLRSTSRATAWVRGLSVLCT